MAVVGLEENCSSDLRLTHVYQGNQQDRWLSQWILDQEVACVHGPEPRPPRFQNLRMMGAHSGPSINHRIIQRQAV